MEFYTGPEVRNLKEWNFKVGSLADWFRKDSSNFVENDSSFTRIYIINKEFNGDPGNQSSAAETSCNA